MIGSNDKSPVRREHVSVSRDDVVRTRKGTVASCNIVDDGGTLRFIVPNNEIPEPRKR